MQQSYDVAGLQAALASIPATSWQPPSTYDGTDVHHGYARLPLFRGGALQLHGEAFAYVLDDFAPVRDAFLSRLEPGGFIVPHRDPGPYYERWHLPIITSGVWAEGGENAFLPVAGEPFRVEHWSSHAVWNDGTTARLHLVIDRDVMVRPQDSDGFCTYPIPDERAAFVARVSARLSNA